MGAIDLRNGFASDENRQNNGVFRRGGGEDSRTEFRPVCVRVLLFRLHFQLLTMQKLCLNDAGKPTEVS